MTEDDIKQVQAVLDRVETAKPDEKYWLHIDPTGLYCEFEGGPKMPIPLPRDEQVRVFRESFGPRPVRGCGSLEPAIAL